MKIQPKRKIIGGLLQPGKHKVTITECALELAKENDIFGDRTPQLKVVVKNESGQSTAWMNLKGYQNATDHDGQAPVGHEFRSFNDDSEKFLVEKKTGKRIESKDRSESLQENVANLAASAGITEEMEIEELTEALVGKEVGVSIRENGRGQLEAYYFFPAEEVKSTSVAE